MKKKIRDLTLRDVANICNSTAVCSECPLWGIDSIVLFGCPTDTTGEGLAEMCKLETEIEFEVDTGWEN